MRPTVFFAFAVVKPDSALLFINPEQVDDAVRQHLGIVEIRPYTEFRAYLAGLSQDVKVSQHVVRVG